MEQRDTLTGIVRMEAIYKQIPETEVLRNYLALSKEFQELQLYRKAEKTLLLALEKLPNHPHLLTRLSNLYLKLDMPEKALTMTNRLVRHHPDLPFSYFLRGKIFEELQDSKKAMTDYEKALTESKNDLYVLSRLVTLMIEHRRAEEALNLIREYQTLLRKPFLFAEQQAEALLQLNKHAAAFTKMRDALLGDPANKRLLKRYLQLSSQSGKKSPAEVYQILKASVPHLVSLDELDLVELETGYLAGNDQHEEALARISAILKKEPESYFWRKRRAFLKLEMGNVEESVEEFRILFLQDSTDKEVRSVLENYFLVQDQLDNWKHLVQQVLLENANQVELFNYLRGIGAREDWLAICEMDHRKFVESLEHLNIINSDVRDVTYEKLPTYALEIFISQISIHNYIPNPADLWAVIYQERKKKGQVPPFQLEDLEAAYPVWVFALHVYFLLKTYSKYPVSFVPRLFQNEQVAATAVVNGAPVQVDISMLLRDGENRRLKALVKSDDGFRWRWRPSERQAPEMMLHEISFYSPDQFKEILREFEENLAEALALS